MVKLISFGKNTLTVKENSKITNYEARSIYNHKDIICLYARKNLFNIIPIFTQFDILFKSMLKDLFDSYIVTLDNDIKDIFKKRLSKNIKLFVLIKNQNKYNIYDINQLPQDFEGQVVMQKLLN